jgi:uncharacterized protein
MQSPEMVAEIQRNFIRRVYGWMTLGLVVTATASFFMLANPTLQQAILGTGWLWLVLLFAELGLVIFLTAAIKKLTPAVASLSFIVYAALNGITLSLIFMIYTSSSIFEAFLICACMFGIMSLFGYTTQRDLTAIGTLGFMGLIGFLLASVLNIFLKSPAIYWITTYLGVAIFVGLIAYDTQKLKNMSIAVSADGEIEAKASILGALALYLDFINLFLLLLRIFGRRR